MYYIDIHIELHVYYLHGCVTGKVTCLVGTVKPRCDWGVLGAEGGTFMLSQDDAPCKLGLHVGYFLHKYN